MNYVKYLLRWYGIAWRMTARTERLLRRGVVSGVAWRIRWAAYLLRDLLPVVRGWANHGTHGGPFATSDNIWTR